MFAVSLGTKAQINNVNTWEEDTDTVKVASTTTQGQTLAELMKTRNRASDYKLNAEHYENVWKRRSYLNIGYNNSTLKMADAPADDAGLQDVSELSVKSNWGANITKGCNYRLHKKPIANMVGINLDYNYINVNVNHYKAEKINDGKYYPEKIEKTNYYRRPWECEKYEFNYAMEVGPSVTVAPLISLNNKNLNFLMFNIYYHIGYNASLLYTSIDVDEKYKSDQSDKFDEAKSMEFGHGLITSFGFNLSWKSIGIGYETTTYKNTYKSLVSKVFGKEDFKLKNTTSRIYVQFRM